MADGIYPLLAKVLAICSGRALAVPQPDEILSLIHSWAAGLQPLHNLCIRECPLHLLTGRPLLVSPFMLLRKAYSLPVCSSTQSLQLTWQLQKFSAQHVEWCIFRAVCGWFLTTHSLSEYGSLSAQALVQQLWLGAVGCLPLCQALPVIHQRMEMLSVHRSSPFCLSTSLYHEPLLASTAKAPVNPCWTTFT